MRNEKGNVLVFVLAGFLLLAIGAAGYFFWQNQLKQETIDHKSPSAENQVQNQKDASVDKTYTSDRYNFSFNYPSTWNIEETEEFTGDINVVVSTQDKTGSVKFEGLHGGTGCKKDFNDPDNTKEFVLGGTNVEASDICFQGSYLIYSKNNGNKEITIRAWIGKPIYEETVKSIIKSTKGLSPMIKDTSGWRII